MAFELFVIVLLVAINGVFVAAEIALVSIRRSRVEQLVEEGRRGAHRVRSLTLDPGRFLAVVQIAVTFVGFLAAAFAGVNLSAPLAAVLVSAGLDANTAGAAALIIVTVLVSLFTIVFGELVPKTLALAHPESFATALAVPVDVLGRVLHPIVVVLTRVTTAIARLLGAEVTTEQQISAEELRLIVERGGEQGVLEAEEEQMINAVIELGDRRVHEVMVPRVAIAALPGERDDGTGDRPRDRGRATRASPSTTTRSTRSWASSTPRTCCRTSSPMRVLGRPCASCCDHRCSCPSR